MPNIIVSTKFSETSRNVQSYAFRNIMRIASVIFYVLIAASCNSQEDKPKVIAKPKDTVQIEQAKSLPLLDADREQQIKTGNTKPEDIIAFAKTLTGVPYRYGSADLVYGFDCSGFITYVFNHFNIAVPRSSAGFADVKTRVELTQAKPGDLILFTGTDSTVREVGHMGIIITIGDHIEFIHSSSGKAHGVTITPLSEYYMGRFVKVIRVFNL